MSRPHNIHIDELYHQLNQFNILDCASFYSFFKMIENIEGDIVECGIGRSRSLSIICSLTNWMSPNRAIHAYDSFAGFPMPSNEDKSYRNPKMGEWSKSPSGKYVYDEAFCKCVLEAANLELDKIKLHLHKGYFEETLPKNDLGPIDLLNIDGDLYNSYIACLENLYPKVSQGGVILFDDFSFDTHKEEAFPGSRKAALHYFGETEYNKIKQNRFGRFYYIKQNH